MYKQVSHFKEHFQESNLSLLIILLVFEFQLKSNGQVLNDVFLRSDVLLQPFLQFHVARCVLLFPLPMMLHSAAENTLKLFLKEIIYAKALYLIPFKLRTDVFFRPFETWMKLKKLICGSTHKCLDITVFHIMPLICRS